MRKLDPRSILVIVQNLPLPGDRRVWLECQALIDAGYQVAAITPKAEGDPAYQFHEGVHLYKYDAHMASSGSVAGFIREFATCWIRTALLAIHIFRVHRFSVIQACNPPDTYWLLALLFRLFGVRFVFDQHDLCPELFESRFSRREGMLYRALLKLEKLTYLTADQVIVTNDSYREVAIKRGGLAAEKVTVVRTGPDPDTLRPTATRQEESNPPFMAAYVGVMGPQDGVDLVIRAADHVVNRVKRHDIQFTLAGSGDCWQELVNLRDSLGLSTAINMPGRVSDDELFALLSHAHVGLSPDPPGPLNDVSTMNKTMEYMSFGLPVLAFPLPETKISAADSAMYVEPVTAESYGEALITLIDDPTVRISMGSRGRQRVVDVLAWRHQRDAYVNVFDRLLREEK